MKKVSTKVAVALVLAVFIMNAIAPSVSAQTATRKLGRGFANMFLGFLELPQNVVDTAESDGALAAITYGIVRGTAMSVLRTSVGVYETITFLIPLPWAYETIIEPEFMMSDENY